VDDCDDGVCLLVEEVEGEFGIAMDGFLCGRGGFFSLRCVLSRHESRGKGWVLSGYFIRVIIEVVERCHSFM